MYLDELPKNYVEAVKVISENRHKMTESRRNTLTEGLIAREIIRVKSK